MRSQQPEKDNEAQPNLNFLVEYRSVANLSQDAAACFFGMKNPNSYNTIGDWEREDEQPSSKRRNRKRRDQFREYLWSLLCESHREKNFEDRLQLFKANWKILVRKWKFPPLNEEDINWLERADCEKQRQKLEEARRCGEELSQARKLRQARTNVEGEAVVSPDVFPVGQPPNRAVIAIILLGLGVGVAMIVILRYIFMPNTQIISPTPILNTDEQSVVTSATSSPPLNPQAGDLWIDSKYGITFVYVPGGDFLMGSSDAQMKNAFADCQNFHGQCDEALYSDEVERLANPAGFWISRTEVTNTQYKKCLDETECTEPSPEGTFGDEGKSEYPVNAITWTQANQYARWVGGQLPTEKEWEKAARGTDGRIYPWGNGWNDKYSNYCDRSCAMDWKDREGEDSYAELAPVGSYLDGKSPYGVLDMAGNVWEWIEDEYDFPCEEAIQCRVIRGGSWVSDRTQVRTAQRDGAAPGWPYIFGGIRVVHHVPSVN